jgi:phosphotriesterase-related protein
VSPTGEVQTFAGPVAATELGTTLIHEHVFVGHPELDLNLPHPEWDEEAAVETAVAGLERLWELGVRTVVDLTVLGLGRDVARVARVAARTRVQLVASTGYYTADVLPAYFSTHGPGRLVGGPDPLLELFVRDITEGIAGTGVRAGMLKVVTDRAGLTPDVRRVIEAAAEAHLRTGVPITTHTHAPSRNGRDQLDLLRSLGVAPERLVIGHCGDSEDLTYLRELMDAGATIGMDRFGMEHVLPDEARVATVLALLREGYADRMVLSHDAAFFSRVTPPSWRAAHVPHWRMDNIPTRIVPRLRDGGATEADLHQLLVVNPARVLTPGVGA